MSMEDYGTVVLIMIIIMIMIMLMIMTMIILNDDNNNEILIIRWCSKDNIAYVIVIIMIITVK